MKISKFVRSGAVVANARGGLDDDMAASVFCNPHNFRGTAVKTITQETGFSAFTCMCMIDELTKREK